MPARLSQLDIRIIEQLQEDGRRAFTAIAKTLGVSEGTVRQRVGRLRRSGIIQIVAVADPLELHGGVMATVGVRVRGRGLMEAARRIADLPEVTYLVLVAGSVDMLVELVCRDREHLLRVLSEDIARLPGVEAGDTFTFLLIVKKTYRWSSSEVRPNIGVPSK